MQGTRLKEKVNIFISSNCGGRYTLVREALRLLLLETGMCEVYMFEEEGATTSDVVSSYMTSSVSMHRRDTTTNLQALQSLNRNVKSSERNSSVYLKRKQRKLELLISLHREPSIQT